MSRQNKHYRFSRWCKYFTQNDTVAFFHSISLALIFLPKVIGDKLLLLFRSAELIDKIIAEIGYEKTELLKRENFLVIQENNDFDFLCETREKLKKRRNIRNNVSSLKRPVQSGLCLLL
jgi:hypothetical protein